MLHGIPRLSVLTTSLHGKMLLRPASSTIIAVVRAEGSLASNAFIAGEAGAHAGLAVAKTLIGAFSPGVQVVGSNDITDPSVIVGASALRAIRTGPFRLHIETSEALAVVVHLASSMIGAMVLAETSLAMSLAVPGDLAPRLSLVSGSTGRG